MDNRIYNDNTSQPGGHQPLRPTPPMNSFDAVKKALTSPTDFSGRSRRSEFWWFMLFYYALGQIAAWIFTMTSGQSVGLGAQYAVMIALLLPLMAVQVRRLHDAGHGAWWAVIFLILNVALYGSIVPIYDELMKIAATNDTHAMERLARGHSTAVATLVVSSIGYTLWGIVMLIFNVQDSDPGENAYGKSPKYHNTYQQDK